MTKNDPLADISTRATPQSQPIPGRTDQVKNNAGGYAFQVDDWTRLRRFLVLGTTGGTYYVSERELTKDAATAVFRCVELDGRRAVDEIVQVSVDNLAPKVQPTIFALAVAASAKDDVTRRRALDALPNVCRTGYHLFLFARYVEQFRGWGRGLRRAVAQWYVEKDTNPLALQLVKYRQREGWSHRDLLRLAHPHVDDPAKNAMFKYVVDRDEVDTDLLPDLPSLIWASEEALKTTNAKELVKLIQEHNLPWETLPSESLKSPEVWDALLPKMGLTALIRNLGRMSSIGLLTEFSDAQKIVIDRLSDQQALERSRIHPFSVLLAQTTYSAGRGVKGSLTWTPLRKVTDVLNDAFYAAFGNVTPSGKNTLIGLDVSGSMSWGSIANSHLTPAVAAAAMCLVTAATEPNCEVMGFSHQFVKLNISPSMRLDAVVRETARHDFGATDCALPMAYATERNLPVDTFVVYTDNETWYGGHRYGRAKNYGHPTQALQAFRQKSGRDARSIVVGMTATDISIADPQDPGQLDVTGFDASAPELIANFSAGRV